jgi:tRNA G18 (ribose-2'-O)-methylase SpoU
MRKLRLEELDRISVPAFKQMSKRKISVVLDNVRSGLNVGSVFRTADAFAIEHIYLCGITCQPPHREILKSAIGATESVDWSGHSSTLDCVTTLRGQGWKVIGVEQTAESVSLEEFNVCSDEKIAVVFGNEVDGLSDQILPALHQCVVIPQWGTKHSLNVSVCAGIVLWHLASKIGLAGIH